MSKLSSRVCQLVAVPAVLAATAGVVAVAPSPALAAPNGWELAVLSVSAAHKISKGEGVTVAVIDTGIRTDHKALRGRATEGIDFLAETDQKESWYGRHGTSMASSVLDVAPAAKVLGFRAIRDREDPDYKTWLEGIEYYGENPEQEAREGVAVERAIRAAADQGVQVISLSLGSETSLGAYVHREAEAIAYALSKGVVVVAGAGNAGDELNELSYPAAYPGVIAVGAATPRGTRAEFSQVHNYVDVVTPGVEIYSANIDGGRKKVQGTSSATALAAGVAALIVAKYPDLSPRQVEQLLEQTASTYRKGHNPQTGYGVVDAEAALKAAARLKPGSAALPVGKEGVGGHFGPGDDGTPLRIGQPWDTSYLVVGGIGGGLGLLGLALGLILFLAGRRAAARSGPPVPAPR
ncbi:S8 family serine peptidase [Micromonospora sp. DR5-3]|uniref:S8 family serine peptidase n=1 Tax=unclassified Micromonospora TaxID=2617518 RepID=UPI0016522EA1|nr:MULTISPECIES: S8 family serine peptidase [unclassified Micromonospora]MCW3816291.1 S8 family serine peptidase [Micromonospora sp. DR5-3]